MHIHIATGYAVRRTGWGGGGDAILVGFLSMSDKSIFQIRTISYANFFSSSGNLKSFK